MRRTARMHGRYARAPVRSGQLLQQANPDIAALSKEYGFWKGLRNVLKETEQRTQAQGPGLISSIAGTGAGSMTGAVVGLTGGGAAEMLSTAALTGVAAKQLTRMMQSPYWKTAVAAPMKHSLAQALASGSTVGGEQHRGADGGVVCPHRRNRRWLSRECARCRHDRAGHHQGRTRQGRRVPI